MKNNGNRNCPDRPPTPPKNPPPKEPFIDI